VIMMVNNAGDVH